MTTQTPKKVYDGTHGHGKSTIIIKCPVCSKKFEAYCWSYAAVGKRCPHCKAKVAGYPD